MALAVGAFSFAALWAIRDKLEDIRQTLNRIAALLANRHDG
jgi:hypothetical protein